MANLVYKRVSTDQQSTARQNLVLDEAGIENPVVFEEDSGTSSRLHPLQRPKFRELLDYARPGDTVHISEMFRLVRGTSHILDVLDVLHHDRLAPRIHDGAFSAMDLTARHPRTGELLSTVKFMVQSLAAAGELLARCQPLDGTAAIPAQRKARREYENRVNTLTADACRRSRQPFKIISWRVSGVSGSCPPNACAGRAATPEVTDRTACGAVRRYRRWRRAPGR
ncbi:recombinase family protein [Streptomyces sp. NPDC001034]|uniref:recombinase family protein n=1 Tax=Streptomyces sp. NPDC001034 TaxID=3154375 RepID=UPI00332510D2